MAASTRCMVVCNDSMRIVEYCQIYERPGDYYLMDRAGKGWDECLSCRDIL